MSYVASLCRRKGLYFSVLALLTARLLLVSSYGDILDICVVDRAVEDLPPLTSFVIPIRDSLLHNYTVATLWILLFLYVFSRSNKGAAIFLVSFLSLWFHLTYWFLLLLKGWLDDATCSFGRFLGQPNSVSGHYCYFTYCFLSLLTLFQVKLGDGRPRKKQLESTWLHILDNYVLKLLLSLFVLGGIVTVYRTFFHGYHSLRQVLYGISLGCLSHSLMETILWEYFLTGRHVSLILGLLAVSSPNLLFFCTLLWPFPVYGYPVGSKQVMAHVVNWLVLFITRKAWTNYVHSTKGRTRDDNGICLRELDAQDILKNQAKEQ